EADFTDPSKPGVEIDEDIISPRLDMRYLHSDEWTSRFSAGRGYRAPLSFFESDHGILDKELGFDIAIDKLERSLSANYTLSYEGPKLSLSASLAYTEVDNLANLEEGDGGISVLAQLDQSARVSVADIAMSYALSEQLNLTLSLENVDYDHTFRQAFSIVPITRRLVASADWEYQGWDIYL
ncbi:MAG: TonB-dependent receptor, partial [Cellvibrionaceae bacterium]|nr:TonB-dependent receptor [Cellvibrionaceae bacterium]